MYTHTLRYAHIAITLTCQEVSVSELFREYEEDFLRLATFGYDYVMIILLLVSLLLSFSSSLLLLVLLSL